MTSDTLHIVFNPSGSGQLRRALFMARRNERVICLNDNLSIGPINPPDTFGRMTWVEEQLGISTPAEVIAHSDSFWQESLSSPHRKVVWMTRRSAMEYAGFLEWLWRAGDQPCDIVDLTEFEISHDPSMPPAPLGVVAPEIIRDNLLDQSKPLETTERHRYHATWHKLRDENAAFRVIEQRDIISAPISFFDRVLLSHVTDNWRKVSRVVGGASADVLFDQGHHVSDLVLAARINALVADDALECQGDNPLNMRLSEVRLTRQIAASAD